MVAGDSALSESGRLPPAIVVLDSQPVGAESEAVVHREVMQHREGVPVRLEGGYLIVHVVHPCGDDIIVRSPADGNRDAICVGEGRGAQLEIERVDAARLGRCAHPVASLRHHIC